MEAIRAMRAKIAITADTAPNKVGRAASANDNRPQRECVQYWEIIADNLSASGWT